MSTAQRKARKRAGIQFTKPQKVATRSYETKGEAQTRRARENRQDSIGRSMIHGISLAMSKAIQRSRGFLG